MKLSAQEQYDFQRHEKTITENVKTFIEVGTALADIRDRKLYRLNFDTFEDYCRERWGWERRHAYRMIEAAEITEMCPTGHIQSERQARELVPLKHDPEAIKAVVGAVVENAKATGATVTSQDIKKAVQERTGRVPTTAKASVPPPAPAEKDHGTALRHHWKAALKTEREAFLKWTEGRGSDLPKGDWREFYAACSKVLRLVRRDPAMLQDARIRLRELFEVEGRNP